MLPYTRERIPPSWSVALTWGGLRGGLPMVLVLSLPQHFLHRDLLISMTFGGHADKNEETGSEGSGPGMPKISDGQAFFLSYRSHPFRPQGYVPLQGGIDQIEGFLFPLG